MRYLCTISVALVAAAVASVSEAQKQQVATLSTVQQQPSEKMDYDLGQVVTIDLWRMDGFIGADKPFDTGLLPPNGKTWPLYARKEIADAEAIAIYGDAAAILRNLKGVIVEVCPLVKRADGTSGPAPLNWQIRRVICRVARR